MSVLGYGILTSPVSTGLTMGFKLPLMSWNGAQRYSSAEQLRDAKALTLVIGGASIRGGEAATGATLSVNGIYAPLPNLPDQDPPVSLYCRLEYGDGAGSRVVDFDWCAGSYNLPPCNFVRVTACSDGGLNAGYQVTLNAYVREGSYEAGAIPTATFSGQIDAGSFPVPEGARAVELMSNGTLVVGNDLLAAGQVLTIERDDASGILRPPWNPVRVVPASTRFALGGQFDPQWQYAPLAGAAANSFRCVRWLLAL